MCVHQLLRKYDYILRSVMVISKSNQNLKPNMFQPITIEWSLTFTIFVTQH